MQFDTAVMGYMCRVNSAVFRLKFEYNITFEKKRF